MSIKYRIYLSLLLLSLLPLALVSLITEHISEKTLKQNILHSFHSLAHEKTDSIGRYLDERINETRLLASHPTIITAVQKANKQYQGRDKHEVMAEIQRIDKSWITSKGTSKTAEQIANNPISHFLSTIQARNPELYGEIFLTDSLGTNVAMTKSLSDYYQADEYWWQTGNQYVQEGAFLDDRGFDASVAAIVIGVVVPVLNDGEVIGIFKINFKVHSILDIVSGEGLEPGDVLLLVRSDGSIISSSDESHLDRLSKEEMRLIESEGTELREEILHDKNLLTAQYPMKHSFSMRQTQGAIKGITGETTLIKTWYVIYEVDQEIAYASVKKLRETSIILAIGVLILVAFIGLLLSRAITRPLSILKNGTDIIGAGNLTHRITLKTRNEFGILANSFNNMTQRLQETLISRDKNEALTRTLIETLPDLIWLKDPQGIYLSCNPKFERFFGEKATEIVGKTDYDFIDKELADFFREKDKVAMALSKPSINEEELTYADDGHKEIVETIKIPMYQADGKLTGILGIARDITERKQHEAFTAFQASRAEALLGLPQAAEQIDETSFMLHGLALAEELTNSDISFFHFIDDDMNSINRRIWSKNAQDNHYPIKEADIWADALQQRKAVIHNNYFTSLNKHSMLEGHSELKRLISLPLIEHGKVVMLCGIANKDIDYNEIDVETVQLISNEIWRLVQRRRSENQLNKLAQAMEQSPESIVIVNLAGNIEYVNKAFIHKTGYSQNEVIGQNPSILKSGKTPPETFVEMWDMLAQNRSWKGEFYNKRKDGTEYTEFAQISPICQTDGSVTHYLAIKEDITEKKKLAQELDNHRHHLEEKVKERTTQLAEARERAETANQAKSIFLANMSHEIRTPMNAIVGLTHLLQRANPAPEQAARLGKIESSASHLLSIINDILDLSKIEAGKLILETSNFHLDSIFDHIFSLLKDQAGDKWLTLEVDKNSVPTWLRGDPTRLRQALLNFVGNAIKFSEQGTIYLRAKKLEERGSDILVRFEVQDNGIGIEPDRLSSLYQAFEQADTSTTRKYGGTGLGLVITRHLAQMMGGEVGVKSEPGQGSTFWFTAWLGHGHGIMPTTPATEVTDAETKLRTHYTGSHILLVEDNAINREVALELLSSVGLAVDIATNGLEAVEKVRAMSYDLVLMDIQMPEMDGLEATRIIRLMAEQTNLPILAMSANIFEEDRHACQAVGMNAFVAKPFDLENLFSTIAKWLPERESLVFNKPIPPTTPVFHTATDDTALRKQLSSIEGIDAQQGLLNMRDDATAYLRLLRQFNNHHGDDMRKLSKHLASSEVAESILIAHTIKGSAATLGLTKTLEITSALEKILRSDSCSTSNDEIFRLINAVSTEQKNIRLALSNLSIPEAPEHAVVADQVSADKILEQLESLLKTDDSTANVLFSESEALLKSTFGSILQQLGQQIEVFDYPAALKTIRSISKSENKN